jgi:hypothetical protein
MTLLLFFAGLCLVAEGSIVTQGVGANDQLFSVIWHELPSSQNLA